MPAAKPLPSQGELKSLYTYVEGELIYTENGNEVNGTTNTRGYVVVRGFGRNMYKHRVIWKLIKGYDPHTIDHINNVKTDNRIENLRDVNQGQNVMNSIARGGVSHFKGVCFSKEKGKFRSLIQVNGKRKHLGYFNNEVDAARAYDSAALLFHGVYAKTNDMLDLY